MNKELEQDIYFTLLGQYAPEYAVPGVPNAFAPDSVCTQAYDRMHEYRERLWQRLGVPEDEDLEKILMCMETIQQELCIQMFHRGQQWKTP